MQMLKCATTTVWLWVLMLGRLWRVNGSFFICPAPCQAMYLPIDMDSLDDCLCLSLTADGREVLAALMLNNHNEEGAGVLFECPPYSSARRLHPRSFADCECAENYNRDESSRRCIEGHFLCYGKYQIKPELEQAQSLSDCNCVEPYTKDEATGKCLMLTCPRAGNYIPKASSRTVQTLADCDCTEPLVKNDQSGECVTRDSYQCPKNSRVIPGRQPKHFADCECNWGFVRKQTKGIWGCAREGKMYECPPLSIPRIGLRAPPRSFADCECLPDYPLHRHELTQSCNRYNEAGRPALANPITCPPFSRAIAPVVHDISQCQCIDGYGFKNQAMVCESLSAYKCPPHSRRSRRVKLAEKFQDCICAKGYFRDEATESCRKLYLTDGNGCPKAAFLTRWPLQISSNCRCVHDFDMTRSSQEPTCNEPATSITECAPNSFLNNWPLASTQDCSCQYGYDRDNKSPGCERVNDKDLLQELRSTCDAPLVRNKLSGECRLPVEEVEAKTASSTRRSSSSTGEVIFNGIEYTFVLVEDNVMVIQGDVAIGELATTHQLHPNEPVDFTHYILHGYYNDERDHRWKSGKMCYEYSASGLKYHHGVEHAMHQISMLTGFQFRKCGGGTEGSCSQDQECHDYVRFIETQSSCWSYIGRIGGHQSLGVSSDCGDGNLMHVLLHAIGLHHTIDRPDRDDHVRIAWECIPEDKRSYFIVEDTAENKDKKFATDVPYDFYSIMHHPSDAFVDSAMPDWCRSVFPVVGKSQQREQVLANMGQRHQLSITDVHYVWAIYPFLKNEPALQQAIDLGQVEVHVSRLHSANDVNSHLNTSTTRSRVAHVIAAFCVLSAFGATAFFVVLELKKRSLHANGDYYAESLLDKNLYD